MRVRYIVEVPSYKAFKDFVSFTDALDRMLWQECSGKVVGIVIDPPEDDD